MRFACTGWAAAGLLGVLVAAAACSGSGEAAAGRQCSGPFEEDTSARARYDYAPDRTSLHGHPLETQLLALDVVARPGRESELQRLLKRQSELKRILFTMRSLERARVAGWAIDWTVDDEAQPAANRLGWIGWIWLTGDEPPCSQSARIADSHPDLEIRTGAAHTHQELLDAAEPLATQTEIEQQAGIACTGREPTVDMHANRLNIVVYVYFFYYEEIKGLTPSQKYCEQESLRWSGQTTAEIERDIEDSLRAHISVPFAITIGADDMLDAG